jgi:diaminopimelate decarboxylase
MDDSSLRLPFTEEEIKAAINTYGRTPFFLYSEDVIQSRSYKLQDAFKKA